MKQLLIICVVITLSIYTRAQQAPAQAVAEKIARKMKDSLSLTDSQWHQVYDINMRLHAQKSALRTRYSGAELTLYTQQVEDTRDSLYRMVLPRQVYHLYKRKKDNLVINN